MDSSSGKSRRRRRSSAYKRSRSSSSNHSSNASPAVFSNPVGSRATVVLSTGPKEKPVGLGHLVALAAVTILILLGGSHNLYALGWALLLPGVWMFIRPPEESLSRSFDYSVVVFLSVLLLAFIPQFYWPTANWRETAVETFGIDLPGILSIQPGRSFGSWILCLAGVGWFYVLLNTPINFSGRKRLHLWTCVVVGLLAAIVLWGNLADFRYPGAGDATAFSFFPNRNQTSNFLALGGVFAFGYGMNCLRSRKVVHLTGLITAAICLGALLFSISRAGILLYFAGIAIWYIFRIRRAKVSLYLKFGLPLVLLFFSFFISSNERVVERVTSFVTSPEDWSNAYRTSIYRDTFDLIREAPVAGVGMGNFEAVFPQYRDQSRNHQRVAHPESDYLWVASESGLLGLICLGVLVAVYFRSCRGTSGGKGGSYRIAALVAVIIFGLHGMVDVSGHRPGTAYFAILLSVLALPTRRASRPRLPRVVFRVLGGVLSVFGLIWIIGGLFGKPARGEAELAYLSSLVGESIAGGDFEEAGARVTKRIATRPMDWQGYYQRAQLTLSQTGNISEAASDFRRARFVEPVLAAVSYDESFVWIPYDLGRVVSAWRKTLFREAEDMDRLYTYMIRAARKNPALMKEMSALSDVNQHYRSLFILSLKGEALMREMNRELMRDESLADFSPEQRRSLLMNWIERGDLDSAGAFLGRYEATFENAWWLRSSLYRGLAKFDLAVEVVREFLSPPEIPYVEIGEGGINKLERGFALSKKDVMRGTALLKLYLNEGNQLKALEIAEALCDLENPPSYALYWRGELLYGLGDYVESWYSFEEYISRTL